jgi:hypothetical protein
VLHGTAQAAAMECDDVTDAVGLGQTGRMNMVDRSTAKPTAQKGSFELSMAQLEMVAGGIEQVLNISSQCEGSGSGKVTFNPF